MTRKILLFPYNQNTELILQNKDQLASYRISGVASFKEDCEALRNCESRHGMKCSDDYMVLMKDTETVLLVEPTVPRSLDSYLQVVHAACAEGKTVYCSRKMKSDIIESHAGLAEKLTTINRTYELKRRYDPDRLSNITVPIILVAGEGEDCSKFEMQLLLRAYLNAQGYNTSCLCSNDYGSLFGMYTTPEDLFSASKSLEVKVHRYNHYVHDICVTEKPDVLVIGVPGGLTRLNDDNTNHFSEVPLVICNAVNPDAAFVNLFFDTRCTREMLKSYVDCCKHKFGIPLVELGFSRQRVLYNVETERFEYYHLGDKVICKPAFQDYFQENTIVNIADHSSVLSACNRLLEQLQSNPCAI